MSELLMCPICREALHLDGKTWQCAHRHSYDQAKQGYVNLHVVQHKHSKSPGDTPEAVAARRRFLQSGAYQPLQQAVSQLLQSISAKAVLDIGCGEGYYTQAMAEVVPQVVAVDIAKSAVQTAAKQSQQSNEDNTAQKITWVVGTGAVLPVLDQSIDVCSSLFSPLPKMEMLRVLKKQGYLIIATPAPQHLFAMREALFDEVKAHEPDKFLAQMAPEFSLVSKQIITTDLNLDQNQLKDLIAMTPYAWKAKADKRQALEAHQSFQLSASFCLFLLQKCVD
ncbi:methyltransferase domain-containing protein [Acinetobacter sp. A3.8]|uniref:Methyltransferase domain-containing protein n=1 Tax=Acinetobacter sedimenti TaxID=2919922 RepID=A0A9X1X057_9GAMM|nr:methyltransferase domain-containing protein [Acinetobacter sedimenti]MCJ8145421.1 methyltransferase domain-containing protein [Acinetobacter sedimenti]